MATIEVLTGPHAGMRHELTQDQTVVGRYPFCDMVLDDHTVSRQHTRFIRSDNEYFVEDMGSLNGTFVNGKRVDRRRQIFDQDRIHIYETLIVFHEEKVEEENGKNKETAKPTVQGSSSTPPPPRPEQVVNALPSGEATLDQDSSHIKLQQVLNITQRLGSTLHIDELLPKILDAMFVIFPQSERGYILLKNEALGTLELKEIKQRGDKSATQPTMGPISQSMANRVMQRKEAVLTRDAFQDSDNDLSDSVLDFPIRSMMCAPLMGPMRVPLGIIYVDTEDPRNRFDEDDLAVLLSIATIAGQSLEYAKAHEAAMLAIRQERELEMAREVQQRFLPQRPPELPDYEFCSFYRSALELGGDYFGYTELPDGRLAITMADVAGKGVSAALLMAQLCGDVRLSLMASSSPAQAVERLNQDLIRSGANRFVTFALVVLDPRRHTVSIVNAGHMPPLLKRGATGMVENAGSEVVGLPLVCEPNCSYHEATILMEPGDSLLLFTDGISDAMNAREKTFGMKRIGECLAQGPAPAKELVANLLQKVSDFTEDHPQIDDMCVVCFRRIR